MHITAPISIRRPSNTILAVGVTFFTSLYFYLPVMTIYLFYHGLDLFQVSVMSSVIVAVQFLAEVPSGIVADRWGRKPAWVLAVTLQLAGEVWFFFARSFWEFGCIAVLSGLGYAFASGAIEALIYDTLPEEDREAHMKQAMGKIMAAQFAGNLVAFLASGLILLQTTPARFALAIGLTAASVAVGWVITLFIFEPQQSTANRPQGAWWWNVRDGLGLLRGNPGLRRIALLMVLSDPFSFYLMSYYQPFFANAGVASAWFGPVLAVGSLLAGLASRYAYLFEARLGMRLGLLVGTGLPGIIYVLMVPVRHPALAVGLVLLQYGVMYAARPLLRTYVNGFIAAENRATVLSIIQLFSSVYLALMGLALGWIGDRSLPGLFAVMGVVVLAAAFAFQVKER